MARASQRRFIDDQDGLIVQLGARNLPALKSFTLDTGLGQSLDGAVRRRHAGQGIAAGLGLQAEFIQKGGLPDASKALNSGNSVPRRQCSLDSRPLALVKHGVNRQIAR
ncbi:hypothetical protein SDC9_207212 [bioreactor metagenome]|uniref:Uncharacterized protein n=1 Tax=bioreactor metagenome TaxID=1076179 RepID=A0A645J798_9ZZZZ